MSAFGRTIDRSRLDRLLGEMLGAMAELEAEGDHTLSVADAAVLAAIRKVRRTQSPSVAHAWSLRMQEMFAERCARSDALADDAAERAARMRRH